MVIKKGIFFLALVLLSVDVLAVDCGSAPDPETCNVIATEDACNSATGCVGRYQREYYTFGPWEYLSCGACNPWCEITCKEYVSESQCTNDPCGAVQGTSDSYDCEWSIWGYCYNDYCSGVGGSSSTTCRFYNCYPKYGVGGFIACIECPRDTQCNDYGHEDDCDEDPCRVPGLCAWGDDRCQPDIDGDNVAESEDNCPNVKNADQENNWCTYDCGSDPDCCSRDPGDACDDVDGDGILDKYEDKDGDGTIGAGETNPLDTDSDDNCISDGVEQGFNPIIEDILKPIVVGLAAAMLAYQGLRWITSESPEERNNAKQGIVYIMIGMLLLIGGKEVILFIFYMDCSGETPEIGFRCSCTGAPAGGSCPFIYSYDGERFHYEHESFPFAALRAFEYETYGVLKHLKAVNGSYTLKVSEERDEIAYINGIELFVVDYVGDAIMADTAGGIHTLRESIEPLECIDKDGNDCLPEISEEDDAFWTSDLTGKDLTQEDNFKDYIQLEFENRGVDKIKLLISMEITTLLEEWDIALDDIGKNNIGLVEWILSNPVIGKRWKEKAFSEAMLHVQLWDGTRWIEQGQLGVGREGWVQFLVVVDASNISSEKMGIRLIAPSGTYKINSVLADYSPDSEVVVKSPSMQDAINSNGEDVLEKVADKDDDRYAIIPKGEQVIIRYQSIPVKKGYSRGYVVGAKGYFYLDRVSNTSTIDTIKNLPKYLRMLLEDDYGPRRLTTQYV